MPSANDYDDSKEPIKIILMGDTGAGKTGALASLAAAGYNLRILDLDNGMPILLGKNGYLRNPLSPYVKQSPDCASRVQYMTLTEKTKNINGQLFPASATAWAKTMELLSHWKEKDSKGEVVVDLGPVVSWTEKDILVIDSLSMLSIAAMNFHLAMNGALMQVRDGYNAQRDMNRAQDMIRKFLIMLYDSSIKCNVVLIAHIKFSNEITVRRAEEGDKDASQANYGTPQGYPNAIGAALGPQIGRWFNTALIARSITVGPITKHKIFTQSQNLGGIVVNAKTSAPLAVKSEYPLETGLADYFKAVKGG
jgi:hypothetical protein